MDSLINWTQPRKEAVSLKTSIDTSRGKNDEKKQNTQGPRDNETKCNKCAIRNTKLRTPTLISSVLNHPLATTLL